MKNKILLLILLAFTCISFLNANEKRIIRITFPSSNKEEIEILHNKISNYNKINPNVKIELISRKWTADDPLYSYMRFFSFDNCAIDIFYSDTSWIPLFVSHEWILPLDEYLKNKTIDFIPVTLEAATFNNKLYALPYNLKGNALFYRKDLLEKYNYKEPSNISQLSNIANTIRKEENMDYGLVFHAKYTYNDLLPFFWSNNGQIVDKNGQTHVNSQQNIETMNKIKGFIHNGKGPGINIDSYNDWYNNKSYGEPLNQFISNNAVFMINWSTRWNKLKKSNLRNKIGVMPIPPINERGKAFSTLGAWYFAINKNTKYPKEATDFILYLLSDNIQRERLDKLGELPSLNSFYTNRKNIKMYNNVFPVHTFHSILSNTRIKIPVSNEREIGIILDHYLYSVLSGKLITEKAMNDAEIKIKSSIKQNQLRNKTQLKTESLFVEYKSTFDYKYPLFFILILWIISAFYFYFLKNRYNQLKSISSKLILTAAPLTIISVFTVASLILSYNLNTHKNIYNSMLNYFQLQINEYVKMVSHKTALSSSVIIENYNNKVNSVSNIEIPSEIEDVLSFAHYNNDIIFTQIIKRDGTLASSDKSFLFDTKPENVSEEYISPELALKIKNLKSMNISKIKSKDNYSVVEILNPIYINSIYYGAVRIGFSLKSFETRIISIEKKNKSLVLYTVIISILLAIILSYISIYLFIKISFTIAKPITNLTDHAQIITKGNYDQPIEINNNDETGRLAKAFNYMSQILTFKIVELEETNKKLKEMDILKDNFLANTSHELRTPLNGIIGLTESLLDHKCIKEHSNVTNDVQMILNSSKRLSSLVNDILDFSKLKVEDIVLNYKSVDLYTITSISINILTHIIKTKNISVNNKVPPNTLVNGDEQRLQQIILNLIGNAVKFTSDGEVNIYVEENDNLIIYHVQDTGIGIAENKQSQIFESFQQEDGSISRQYSGTGLGLAISQKLAELHGSRINLQSQKNVGSNFYFALEKSSKDYSENSELFTDNSIIHNIIESDKSFNIETQQKDIDKISILVVDDEPVNLRVLINHLSLAGYNVSTAVNGKDALDIIDKAVPDLILLDIMMPGMSGYEVCNVIRKNHSQYELPIIFLSAKDKPENIVKGLEFGANDYLTKPISKQELLARVNNLNTLKKSIIEHNELNVLKQELQIAHNMQKTILKQNTPKSDKYNFSIYYEPAHHLGGDFYDIRMFNEDSIELLIADVSGHGIPAAFISGMLKVAYSFHIYDNTSSEEMMSRINESMYFYTQGKFITAGYSRINFNSKKLNYCNAGHWPLLIIRENHDQIIQISTKGHAIGWIKNKKFMSTEFDLQTNDILVFYTDGLLEARNKENIIFGEDNFHKLLLENKKLSVEELQEKIITTLSDWSFTNDSSTFEDDITLALLKIK